MSVSARAAPNGSVEVRLDESIPRLIVIIQGPAGGDHVAETLSRTYLERPEVTYMDMLFDLTDYQGEVTAQHTEAIAGAYLCSNRDPSVPCRTAFVTPDPNFQLWATAMSYQFTGREHRAFATFEQAERFLAEPMAERTPFAGA